MVGLVVSLAVAGSNGTAGDAGDVGSGGTVDALVIAMEEEGDLAVATVE